MPIINDLYAFCKENGEIRATISQLAEKFQQPIDVILKNLCKLVKLNKVAIELIEKKVPKNDNIKTPR